MSKSGSVTVLLLLISLLGFTYSLDSDSASDDRYIDPSPTSITAVKGETKTINVAFRGELSDTLRVDLTTSDLSDRIVVLSTSNLVFNESACERNFTFKCVSVGHVSILFDAFNETTHERVDRTFVRVQIEYAKWLEIMIIVVGWVYFAAWSLCYYPQIIKNIQRRSVVGLSFDFQFTSTTGHISYAVFNSCMFWSSTIHALYREKHPTGVNPVLVNDVIFSLHASVVNIIIVLQCCFFERGDQKISNIYKALLAGFGLTIITCGILTLCHVIDWLDYAYMFSYIKLAVTLTKYGPQVYLNYRKKGTVGFSILYAILDFCGGFLSVFQMFLLCFNNNDWENIGGNLSKLGLGVFSIVFDIIFMIQHFFIYRRVAGDEGDNKSDAAISDIEKVISTRRSSIHMLFSQSLDDFNYKSTDNLTHKD